MNLYAYIPDDDETKGFSPDFTTQLLRSFSHGENFFDFYYRLNLDSNHTDKDIETKNLLHHVAEQSVATRLDDFTNSKSTASCHGDYLRTSSHETFSLVRYNPSQIQVTTFQRPHEPRTKYLLRSFKLWQEFTNSGDLDKLRILFKDIFSKDSVTLNDKSTPILGPSKLYEAHGSLLRNIPDYCVFYSNSVRSKRQVITVKTNCFGSLPCANFNNKSTFLWDIFENTSIDQLDEHHRIQKQKYDDLKSQKKLIKFETRAAWNICLNRVGQQIQKMSTSNYIIDIIS